MTLFGYRWRAGIGWWKGKPLFFVGRVFHDWWIYLVHLGPCWAEGMLPIPAPEDLRRNSVPVEDIEDAVR